jgi:hypothetical protein
MRFGAWSAVIMTLALGCSSVNPHYDPTATLASSSVTHGPALAQAASVPQTATPSQTVSSSQTVSPWREDGTRVYSAAKPPVTSLKEALAARSAAVPEAAPTSEAATQVAMKPVSSSAPRAPVAGSAPAAIVASPYSQYSPAPVQPIASRMPTAPTVPDSLATQAIQQTAASVPATPAEPKSNNQAAERVRITSVVQDAASLPSPSGKGVGGEGESR